MAKPLARAVGPWAFGMFASTWLRGTAAGADHDASIVAVCEISSFRLTGECGGVCGWTGGAVTVTHLVRGRG
jgi:hypothetical protein